MRQLVSETGLGGDGCLRVEGKKFHYLSSVLRVSAGDMISVLLPSGALQAMTVAKVEPRSILLQTAGESSEALCTPPKIEITLFQFAAKPPKMDLIVRQAVECGVSRIVPVAGEFCQKGSVESAAKKCSSGDGRWSGIITEAMEQSGSCVRTEILPVMDLARAAEFWRGISGGGSLGVVLYERTEGSSTIQNLAKNAENITKTALVVGAEGGISKPELDFLVGENFVPVHFETNILRCETAALYGIAAIQSCIV